jgi:hypothetical protein
MGAAIIIIFYLALIALLLVSGWKIYEKAGRQDWGALIPIYNIVILMKIIGKPEWWTVLFFIPLVNYIFIIWSMNMLSKSFGKEEGFTVGLVILGIVFYPILAFGDAQHQGPFGDPVAFAAYKNGRQQLDFERNQLSA